MVKKLENIERLLINLLKIDSFSGKEEYIAEYIESQLTHFEISRQYINKNRFNVIAKKGKSNIWLVVHMDTVVGKIPIKITNSRIYGRGATDNKGNIAGAIIAGDKLDNINLLFTIGEEEDFVGAKKANIKGRVIVLEPTNFKRRIAQRGLIIAKIITSGIQKHSGLVVSERNKALHVMVKILNKLLYKKWSGFNIGIFKGGIAANIISDKSKVDISIRPKNKFEYNSIIKNLINIKEAKVKIVKKIPPYISNINIPNVIITPVSFFSELSFFKTGLLFGAGDINNAHSKSEYIIRSELRRLPEELIKLVEDINKYDIIKTNKRN